MDQLTPETVLPFKIVSGGQTGVDRAAMDVAAALGIDAGGWCPNGRLAEDGHIPPRYALLETPSSDPAERTRWNVRDSDGTLIVHAGEVIGGTLLARSAAEAQGTPVLEIDVGDPDAVTQAVEWIRAGEIRILNVAGPRESELPGVYARARNLLMEIFMRVKETY